MRLNRCPAPAGPLEAAPVTALRPAGPGAWAGFWSGDDAYYARRTAEDGGEEWYQVATEDDAADRAPEAPEAPREADVIAIARPVTLVGRVGANASTTLLGSSRRRRA